MEEKTYTYQGKELKDNFLYTEQVIDGNPDSEYLIMCANINSHDTWVWKFCVHEHNYTPVWSSEYGSCNIKAPDLEKAMIQANNWINSIMEFPQNKGKTEWKDLKDFSHLDYDKPNPPHHYIAHGDRFIERMSIELFLMKVK